MTKKIEHYYQHIPGWFDFADLYHEQVAQAASGAHFVEVGAWKGKSAVYMAVEIAQSGRRIQFDCVDAWTGAGSGYAEDPAVQNQQLYEEFLTNIEPVQDYIRPVREWSDRAAQLYADHSLDFVFIDAGHDYENVHADILAWLPKIRPGGILAGHDYHSAAGVHQAVQELLPAAQAHGANSWRIQL